ncbi:hypothetical protein BM1_06855 [Bipolaris maydis]|nr:hypothetical protein BM1_06855 [Bipolaris maydis]KAJ5023902.1 hypothetical protein J3E73DRAFT_373099 [Bipolaris maydis]
MADFNDMAAKNRSLPAERNIIGTMDHVLEILAVHSHPLILAGWSAQRWMGSAGLMDTSCDILVRDSALKSVASDLVETGHWEVHQPSPPMPREPFPCSDRESDADFVLRRIDAEDESEYRHLILWSESTYHVSVDDCPLIEVPDVYPWNHVLIEERWHPAIGQENRWWFGPRLHPDTKVRNLPERATPPTLFPKGAPRGKSPTNTHSVYILSIPAYMDTLVYHMIHYKLSKPGLATLASLQIANLTRYLYLELPHQQLPLLIELEEDEFMEEYLRNYQRKPFFVFREAHSGGLESARVKEWDADSYPSWCRTIE